MPNEDIPNGYDVEKHKNLKNTIAEPGSLAQLNAGEMRLMACHETRSAPCVGWLHHQLGTGNNIVLRIRCLREPELANYALDGDQHKTFEDTIP